MISQLRPPRRTLRILLLFVVQRLDPHAVAYKGGGGTGLDGRAEAVRVESVDRAGAGDADAVAAGGDVGWGAAEKGASASSGGRCGGCVLRTRVVVEVGGC